MLAPKHSLRRRLQIVELVRKRGEISVEELSQAFDVSSVTIRTDLTYLEQQRYLVRTFGKARCLAQKPGDDALTPMTGGAARKTAETAIARLAAESVDDHASLMLGTGDVTHKILPFLSDRTNLALLIQDIRMIPTAQRFLHCELLLTGGQLEPGAVAITGPDAEASVSRRALDVCFLQASGLDRDGNLFCANAAVSRVLQAARRAAARTIVVACQPLMPASHDGIFANLADIDALLMDDGMDPAVMERMPGKGLTLHRRENGVLEFRKPAIPR